ncbi:MAG: hypothetical protein KDC67_08355, partial [Ignavibacteriae bacterium]|nr:hypothetical protein [Ignavibacteriota bacterium]
FNYFINNSRIKNSEIKTLSHDRINELIADGSLIKLVIVDPIRPNTGEIFKLKIEKDNEVI